MQLPESFPTFIDQTAWCDALEGLGIPVRGHKLIRLNATARQIELTYARQAFGSSSSMSAGGDIATVTVTVDLRRRLIQTA